MTQYPTPMRAKEQSHSPALPSEELEQEILRLVDALVIAHDAGIEWPVDPLPFGSIAHDLFIRRGNDPERIAAMQATPETGWQGIETAPKDGSEVLILAHGMAIQARFVPGEWHDHHEGREYDGAIWCAFDDALQFEVEEGALEGGRDCHGQVTHWQPLPEPPASDLGKAKP